MERVTPPPASMPASHAASTGVVGVAGAVFTAKDVIFGTNVAAFLFVGVTGVEPCNEVWWTPPHSRHRLPEAQVAALWPIPKHLKHIFLFRHRVDLSSTLADL